MDLEPYVDEIRNQVAVAADAAGDEARALAERLIAPLDAAIRLAVQHALAHAADEITVELAPGSVELRVRGRDLAFVVTPPPEAADAPADDEPPPAVERPAGADAEMARINLRLPEHLKARVEQAAAAQSQSVNAWLVRAASVALDRADAAGPERRTSRGGNRYRGWAK